MYYYWGGGGNKLFSSGSNEVGLGMAVSSSLLDVSRC